MMATKSTAPFAEAVAACGLTQAEAADLLDVKLPRLQKWSRGAIDAPDWTMDRLAELFSKIDGGYGTGTMPEGSVIRQQTFAALRARIRIAT
jgi:hypothetical protein